LATSEDGKGRFSRMIEAALDAGLKLYVTPGVIEEVERHMNKALTCVLVGVRAVAGIDSISAREVRRKRPITCVVSVLVG
jgi:hypothetical protein